MSLENIQKFLELASSNSALSAKISASVAGKPFAEASIAISELAKSAGFDCTPEEALQFQPASVESEELSEEALNAVAGGVMSPVPIDAGYLKILDGASMPTDDVPSPGSPKPFPGAVPYVW